MSGLFRYALCVEKWPNLSVDLFQTILNSTNVRAYFKTTGLKSHDFLHSISMKLPILCEIWPLMTSGVSLGQTPKSDSEWQGYIQPTNIQQSFSSPQMIVFSEKLQNDYND